MDDEKTTPIWRDLARLLEEAKSVRVKNDFGIADTLNLLLNIEERAIDLATKMFPQGVGEKITLAAAETIARHLRRRLGLPEDPVKGTS